MPSSWATAADFPPRNGQQSSQPVGRGRTATITRRLSSEDINNDQDDDNIGSSNIRGSRSLSRPRTTVAEAVSARGESTHSGRGGSHNGYQTGESGSAPRGVRFSEDDSVISRPGDPADSGSEGGYYYSSSNNNSSSGKSSKAKKKSSKSEEGGFYYSHSNDGGYRKSLNTSGGYYYSSGGPPGSAAAAAAAAGEGSGSDDDEELSSGGVGGSDSGQQQQQQQQQLQQSSSKSSLPGSLMLMRRGRGRAPSSASTSSTDWQPLHVAGLAESANGGGGGGGRRPVQERGRGAGRGVSGGGQGQGGYDGVSDGGSAVSGDANNGRGGGSKKSRWRCEWSFVFCLLPVCCFFFPLSCLGWRLSYFLMPLPVHVLLIIMIISGLPMLLPFTLYLPQQSI